MSFYVFNRTMAESVSSAASGTNHGITLFKDIFRTGAADFESPAQMTNKNDLMGWYNVSFIYEQE